MLCFVLFCFFNNFFIAEDESKKKSVNVDKII